MARLNPQQRAGVDAASNASDSQETLPEVDGLALARWAIAQGAPVFLAEPAGNPKGGTGGTGYWLPKGWQDSPLTFTVLDRWRPGLALCMVTGIGVDVLDIDPRNGGDETAGELRERGIWPKVYAIQTTPSGGTHEFIRSLGIGKTNDRGVDIQAGAPDGSGRGFVFLDPTVRASKTTGDSSQYRLTSPPDGNIEADDESGAALRQFLAPSSTARPDNAGTNPPRAHGGKPSFSELVDNPPNGPDSGRNDWLTRMAGHRLRAHRDDLDAYAEAVRRDNQSLSHPLDPTEVETIIGSIGKSDQRNHGREIPLEDSPLAEFAAERLRDGYCWATGRGWLRFDGKVWAECSDATLVEVVRQLFRDHYRDELDSGASPGRMKALATLLSSGKIRSVVGLVRGILERDSAAFDRHPDLLNCGNGIVDLASGRLLRHDPDLLLTKITKVDYWPDAQSADWDLALEAFAPGIADWMQVRFGQAATGHMTADDLLPLLQGGGANGKSTILDALFAALGDHMVLVPEKVLTASAHDHPTELTTLMGARIAVIEELPEGARFSVKRIKDTLGTARITARKIQKDNITWDATHSLFVTTNYRPRVNETDHGTWRRLALVRFPYTYGPSERDGVRPADPGLRERLRLGPGGQREAVLAWVVEGARRWYFEGRQFPDVPEAVRLDTLDWRGDSDLVLAYTTENLTFDPNARVLSQELFDHFSEWLRSRGQAAWSDQLFTERFEGHDLMTTSGVRKVRTRSTDGLSRAPGRFRSAGGADKQRVWVGVAFQSGQDERDGEVY